MNVKKLVVMANQIGSFFETQRRSEAVSGIKEHIQMFWDPRMRAAIFAHMDAGGADLKAPVQEALAALKAEAARGTTRGGGSANAAAPAP